MASLRRSTKAVSPPRDAVPNGGPLRKVGLGQDNDVNRMFFDKGFQLLVNADAALGRIHRADANQKHGDRCSACLKSSRESS